MTHLEELKVNGLGRPSQSNSRVVLPKGSFNGIRSKHSQKVAKRTISYPFSGSTNDTNVESIALQSISTVQINYD